MDRRTYGFPKKATLNQTANPAANNVPNSFSNQNHNLGFASNTRQQQSDLMPDDLGENTLVFGPFNTRPQQSNNQTPKPRNAFTKMQKQPIRSQDNVPGGAPTMQRKIRKSYPNFSDTKSAKSNSINKKLSPPSAQCGTEILESFLDDTMKIMEEPESVPYQQQVRRVSQISQNDTLSGTDNARKNSLNDLKSTISICTSRSLITDDAFDINAIENSSTAGSSLPDYEVKSVSKYNLDDDLSDFVDIVSSNIFSISSAELATYCTVLQKQSVKDTEFIFVPVTHGAHTFFYPNLPKYKGIVTQLNVRQKTGIIKPLENQLIQTNDVKFSTTNLINLTATECILYKSSNVEFTFQTSQPLNLQGDVLVFVSDKDGGVNVRDKGPASQTDTWLPGIVVSILSNLNFFVRPLKILKDNSRGVDVYVPNYKMPPNALPVQRRDEVRLLLRDGKQKGKLMINKIIVTRYTGRSLRDILNYLKTTLEKLQSDGSIFIQLISLSYVFNYFTKIKFTSDRIQTFFLLHYMRFLLVAVKERESYDEFCAMPFQDLILSPSFNSNGGLIKFLSASRHLNEEFTCKFDNATHSIFHTVTEFLLTACQLDHSLLKRVYPFVCLVNKFETSARVQNWISKMLQFCISGEEIFCNDENWRELRLIPNSNEVWDVSMDRNENLRKVIVGHGYESGEDYMEVYFRLLRAECFSPIQNGIKDLCADKLDPRDLNVYYNVSLRGYDINNSELALAVTFSPVKRITDWRYCSNLMFGNLLCLSPSGTFQNDLIWATVADRDADLLNKKKMIIIQLCRGFNSHNAGEIVFKLIENSGNMTMVESPSYFLSFRPVLESLQSFDIEKFPLKSEIVFCEPQGTPDYLQTCGSTIDASCIFTKSTASMSYDELLQALKTESSMLDESQANAIHHALTHRLAIIQGPPGCGKTFIGAKLAQIILSCMDENAGPILVLSYKNHALDEFLKHIIKFTGVKNVVRVGSRSKDSSLEVCNIKNIERNERPEILKEAKFDTRRQIQDKIEELKMQVDVLYSSTKLTVRSFSKLLTEEQLRSFFIDAQYGTVIKFSVARNVVMSRAGAIALIDQVSLKYQSLQECFALDKHFENSSDEACMTKLFSYLIQVWFPKKETLAALKEFHTAFVKEIEKIKERSKELENTEDTTEEWDEKAIENIMQSRIEAFSGFGGASDSKTENRVIWGNPIKDKKNILILNQLPQKLEVNHSILTAERMWTLSEAQKVHFLFSLIKTKYDKETVSFNNILKELQALIQLKVQIDNEQKAELLSKKKVIGMTIVGACIQQKLIAEVRPSIVIVEEAAEILEPKLLATLTTHLKHLILIGDHMQLRPQVDTYPLRKDYNFDVSMMERLIKSDFPYASLKRQNRMRCEFSALLRDIYPYLLDNLSIVENNEPLECLQKSMYFWTHRTEEVSGRSYKNPEEVERISALVEYLIMMDVSPSDITVLSSYQGQTHDMRKALGRFRVLINTIDMYQGDENKYVIVSLVRSVEHPKKKNPIGFLAELNRRCVAQSRAKCGLYFVGNEKTLSLNNHWNKLISGMREQECVGPALGLQCPKHKDVSKREVSSTEELKKLVSKPHKICSLPCGDEMPCGIPEHNCKRECMSLHQHEQCSVQVQMTFSNCEHTRMKACYQNEFEFICDEKVSIVLRCGHAIIKSCHENELLLKCLEIVKFKHHVCGHENQKECHQNKFDIECESPCERKMNCGVHPCRGETCGKQHSHSKCSELVKYNYPDCGHAAKRKKKCSNPITGKCSFEESIDCGYGHKVNKKCGALPEKCVYPCTRHRTCGHLCSQSCGDTCENVLCSICEEVNKAKIEKAKEESKTRMQQLILEMKVTEEYSVKEVDNTSAEYQTVEDLVVKYVKPEHNWYPTVTKIEKISNMKLLKMFNDALKKANDSYCTLKFHGTDNQGVEGISKEGFRLPKKAGMFGCGIYFATDSSKSAQEIYTKRSNKLLLCKVLLGKSKTVDRAHNTLTLEAIRLEGYDSLYAPRNTKGTGGVLNDEFVIYDPRQALPVYIISYSTASLGNISLAMNLTKTHFHVEKMKPSRYLDMNSPYFFLSQYAEGHFYKMLSLMNVGQSTHKIKEIHIVENGLLEDKFSKKMVEFKKANIPCNPILAFHGTALENIDSILKNNLQMTYAKRQAYGRGLYFSEFPNTSLGYGNGLLLCQLLPGRELSDGTSADIPTGYHSKLVQPNAALQNSSQMVIVNNSDQVLPKFVYYLENNTGL